jgi:hypothetical protein
MARTRPLAALKASSLGLLVSMMKLQPIAPVVFKRPRGKKLARILGRTGRDYPFSSKRQWMRNARQIAAGQLHMAGVPTFETVKAAKAYATQFDGA